MPSRDAEFLKSVLGTKFRQPDGKLICKVGQPWPSGKKIGMITAWNPNFKTAPNQTNSRANAKWKKILEERGKTFQIINAWWPDGSAFEESFAVEGLTHGEARELCRMFDQGGCFYAKRTLERCSLPT
jgi:hypothetical protein